MKKWRHREISHFSQSHTANAGPLPGRCPPRHAAHPLGTAGLIFMAKIEENNFMISESKDVSHLSKLLRSPSSGGCWPLADPRRPFPPLGARPGKPHGGSGHSQCLPGQEVVLGAEVRMALGLRLGAQVEAGGGQHLSGMCDHAQSVPECSGVFQNVPECSGVFQSALATEPARMTTQGQRGHRRG